MKPKEIFEVCRALAEGYIRRGITPDTREWQRSFEQFAEEVEADYLDECWERREIAERHS